MTLIDDVKTMMENECRDLKPDGNSLPTLIYRDREGVGYVLGLADMSDDTARLMTASLVLDEAVEAVYSGFVWSVKQNRDPDADPDDVHQWRGPMPSEHPDRVEQAMIAHYTPDGAAMHFAEVTRSPDAPPKLGAWESDPFTKLGGRVHGSIEGGLKISARLPDELRSIFRQAKAAGDDARKGALRGTMKAMQTYAAGSD